MSPTDARPAPRSIGLHTLWVQVLVALVLACLVVLGPRLRLRAAGAALPFAARPRGYLPIEEVLYQLRPIELGIAAWRGGQLAEYEVSSLEEDGSATGKRLDLRFRVDVLRAVAPEDRQAVEFGLPQEGMHWLRLDGLRTFRGEGLTVFRLAGPRDLRITDAQPCFVFQREYIPMRNGSILQPGEELRLRPTGEELVDLRSGSLRCETFELSLVSVLAGSHDGGEPELVGRLWFNRTVAPFGVVRLELASGSLRLADFGQGEELVVPEPMGHLVEGRSTFAHFCNSCHGETCHEKIDPPQ